MGIERAALQMLIGLFVTVASIAWRVLSFVANTLHLWPTVFVWVFWWFATDELFWPFEATTIAAVLLTIANIVYSIWRGIASHRVR
ncbi:MAG: hypothetical protein IJ547_03540, partial [Clostridia bacterium]|nr:hypothetical protein [Clostridia bacterium]